MKEIVSKFFGRRNIFPKPKGPFSGKKLRRLLEKKILKFIEFVFNLQAQSFNCTYLNVILTKLK